MAMVSAPELVFAVDCTPCNVVLRITAGKPASGIFAVPDIVHATKPYVPSLRSKRRHIRLRGVDDIRNGEYAAGRLARSDAQDDVARRAIHREYQLWRT